MAKTVSSEMRYTHHTQANTLKHALIRAKRPRLDGLQHPAHRVLSARLLAVTVTAGLWLASPLYHQFSAAQKAAAPAGPPAPIAQNRAPAITVPALPPQVQLRGTQNTSAPPPKTNTWSEPEVAAATARCAQLLKSLDVVVVPAAVVREGQCGAPAPMELISLGKSPQVSFSPTVTMTCEMIAALHLWVTKDVQPLAIKHLGAPVIRIDTMSSYSCRTAYGRVKNRLSEHGVANAIDIRAFLTSKGQSTDLLADWGPTARDIAAQVALARATAQKAEAERAAAAAKQLKPAPGPTIAAPLPVPNAPPASQNNPVALPRPTITVGPAGSTLSFPGSTGSVGITNAIGDQPSRLGGPKDPNQISSPGRTGTDGAQGRTQFLRSIHASACKIFGTVLGPEANDAHKNHFHLDMAERKSGSFCE